MKYDSIKRKSIMYLLTLLMIATAAVPGSGKAYAEELPQPSFGRLLDERIMELSPGVTYTWKDVEIERGYQKIHTVAFNLNDNPHLELQAAKTYGKVYGMQTLSGMAGVADKPGNRVIAGINGDYYDMSNGVPLGFFMEGGKLLNNPDSNFAFGLKSDGTTIYSVPPQLTQTLTVDGNTFPITRINRLRDKEDMLVLYTEDYHTSTMTNDGGNEIVAEITSGEIKSGQTVSLRVTAIHKEQGNTPLEPGHVVLSVSGKYRDQLAALQVGSELTASFELEDAWKDVTLAIGGYHMLLVDGQPIDYSGDQAVYPRTAIGTKADGTIVMLELDGRQPGFSEGVTLDELIKIFQDMGVVNAVNLDGGGSATLIAKLPGENSVKVMNSPSDGNERKTSNGLLLVNKASESEPASKLAIAPVKERVLAGQSVTFKAAGVNVNGHPAAISGHPKWSTDEEYGTIDDNGTFTAGNKAGMTTVQASLDQIQGSSSVEVVDHLTELVLPDKIKTYSAGQQAVLSVTAKNNGQVIQAGNDSFEWIVEGDIGTIDKNGVFTAANGSGLRGTIIVKHGDTQTSMEVNVGKLPVILEDFENGFDRYKTESGARYVKSIASLETDEEYVRSGNAALKLEYDFTGWPSTSGTYLEVDDKNNRIVIPDYPEKIGMWVYGDGQKHWLRGKLVDANNGAVDINFTEETAGLDFVGWRYLEADVPPGRPAPLSLDMPVRYMETKATNKNAGVLYVDDIRAVYGPTDEDFTPPVIKNISPADSAVVNDNKVRISAIGEAANYDKETHPGTTLIDPDKIRLYVDDMLVEETLYPPEGLIHYTPQVPLADGTHKVKLKIRDLNGNRAEQEWFFTVETGSSQINYDHPSEVYAGNSFELNINAVKSSQITNGHIELQLDAAKAEDIEVVPNSNLTAEQLNWTYDEKTGIVRIEYSNLAGAALPDEAVLAQLRYKVKQAAEGDMKIEFRSGAFQLAGHGSSMFSFYGIPVTAPIKHHLILTWDEFGTMHGSTTIFMVKDEQGNPVEGAEIRDLAGVLAGITDNTGTVATDKLTSTIETYKLQAMKEQKFSPLVTFKVSEQAGTPIPQNVSVTMWEDTRTTKAFNWHTNPATEGTVVELVKQTDFTGFDANNIIRVQGRSNLFNTYDTGTIRVHKAEATGLEPGTVYVYRVGDGDGNYSDQGTFRTAAGTSKGTKFLFMGDSQAAKQADFDLWGSIFKKALNDHPDTEFVIHGGDLVEDGYKENEWNMWFNAAKDELAQTTIVPVVGNHEVTGGRQSEDYLAHFNHPQNGIESLKGSNFSFDYNNAHFVVLNSEYDLEQQKEWLRNDLKNTDKMWKFVAFHRGPYGSMYDSEHIREVWTPVFDEFEVDVVMNGHDHVYVRSWPMKDMEKAEDGKGTVYIVGGSTGPKYYQVVERDWIYKADGEKVQMYVAANIVDNEVKFEVRTINDRLVDEFTLIKTKDDGSENPNPYPGPGEGNGGTPQPEDGRITLTPVLKPGAAEATASLTAEQWAELQKQAKPDGNGVKQIQVQLDKVSGANGYTLELPGSVWAEHGNPAQLKVAAPDATVVLPAGYIPAGMITGKDTVELTLKEADKSKLPEGMRKQADNRPVIDFTVSVNGKRFEQTRNEKLVRISLPYKPSAQEMQHPHQIAVRFIGEDGSVASIPNGQYDPATKTVVLETTRSGQFAVVYTSKSFGDMNGYGWASTAVEALAVRDVVKGVKENVFNPSRDVTRAEFITMLVRALDLRAEQGASFGDVHKGDFYYEAAQIAKALGIVQGKGNNTFDPSASITRQDMFTMTARALTALSKLKADGNKNELTEFTDHGQVAGYAEASINALVKAGLVQGNGAKLNPLKQATRAETAVTMFRLLQHFVK